MRDEPGIAQQTLRLAYPEALAALVSWHRGDLDAAMDALHEGVQRALVIWPEQGVPDAPAAWLVTTSQRVTLDARRRAATRARHAPALEHAATLNALAARQPWHTLPGASRSPWSDDLIRLALTACDPVLNVQERVALTLATIAGMSVEEIARAFLITPSAAAQRLTRARRRLRDRRATYTEPEPDAEESSARLASARAVARLIFNEGYWSTDDQTPIRPALCRLSMSLAEQLHHAAPDDPEGAALVALMWLHQARYPARYDEEGHPVPLPEQDRARWDHERIAAATALLTEAAHRRIPGPLILEASIAATHCAAPRAEETDWHQIAALYQRLEALCMTLPVRVNRAFAVAQATTPERGLALLDGIPADEAARYHYHAVVRATLLARLGRHDEAAEAWAVAASRATNPTEHAQLRARLDASLALASATHGESAAR